MEKKKISKDIEELNNKINRRELIEITSNDVPVSHQIHLPFMCLWNIYKVDTELQRNLQ